ncbi:MAG: CHC2 zinc finger domain-containing protein [Oscillospiraceae bacterium]
MTDVFREVRERVSAQDAARHYGLTFDRRGWALCPFHNDKHPSMSFRNGRFRCWVCDVGGDSIDFTARLLGLDAMGAVERLNADFGLALPLHRKPTQAEAKAARRRLEVAEAHRAFEAWRSDFINRLNAAFREGHLLLLHDGLDTDHLTEGQAIAIRMHETFEHWSDALSYGTPEEQAQIYRERGAIAKWIEKVLSD